MTVFILAAAIASVVGSIFPPAGILADIRSDTFRDRLRFTLALFAAAALVAILIAALAALQSGAHRNPTYENLCGGRSSSCQRFLSTSYGGVRRALRGAGNARVRIQVAWC
jgi:hypothetical protein